ncbi:MAG: hypothetical protein ACYS7Y_29900 [Planctomycetota bacterium]|jgi:hypothetical protein
MRNLLNGKRLVKRERRQLTEADLLLAELANAYLPIENGAEAAELTLLDFIMRARAIECNEKCYVREECFVEIDEEEFHRGLA